MTRWRKPKPTGISRGRDRRSPIRWDNSPFANCATKQRRSWERSSTSKRSTTRYSTADRCLWTCYRNVSEVGLKRRRRRHEDLHGRVADEADVASCFKSHVRKLIAATHALNLGIHPGPKMVRLEFRYGVRFHICRHGAMGVRFPSRLVVAIIAQHFCWKIL